MLHERISERHGFLCNSFIHREVREMNILKTFIRNEDGATAIEYGLIAALVSIVIVVTLGLVGGNLTKVFTEINTALAGA
jgi:pilus assembly protein Flp/PilA